MRAVVIAFAALLTLGLAAFGVVAAHNASISFPSIMISLRHAAPAIIAAAPRPLVRMADASGKTLIPSSEAAAPAGPVAAPVATIQIAPAAAPVQAPIQVAQAAATAANKTASSGTGTSASAQPQAKAIAACDKPGGMGLSRIVEIDTTGGPAFGFEHFKQYDFLRDKEVVLTFDDGPWPENTRAVLKALADNCLKATFFEIGEHASWHPELSREVAAAGMTIGTHTWSHKDLARNPYAGNLDLAKQEIEMGFSAVHMAVDGPIAPFFRFPDLQQPPALLAYLGTRNIATFSTDIDSRDFKMRKPEQVIESVMRQLEKRGKGIVLMHDFQRATAQAMPELLRRLKAAGYKIVHIVPSHPATTLAKYDDMVRQNDKYMASNNTRPGRSVFHTIGEYYGSPAPGVATGD